MPESKEPYYRRAYQRAFFGTISACVPVEFKREFRRVCQAEGTTVNTVLYAMAKTWLDERGTRLALGGPMTTTAQPSQCDG